MDSMTIRAITREEWIYTYPQSPQLAGQTGCIGHLRGDFDSAGEGFFTSWFDENPEWNNKRFKEILEEAVNSLRFGKDSLLRNRTSMRKYVRNFPESAQEGSYGTLYGFRVDLAEYIFLLRCRPQKGDYDFYCYCYMKRLLDHHLRKASNGVRFINSHYQELFRIPDGGKINISYPNGEVIERTCRYIDETHVQVGARLYHICEFAERMESCGAFYCAKEEGGDMHGADSVIA